MRIWTPNVWGGSQDQSKGRFTVDRNWQNFDDIFHGWDPYMIIRLSMILGAINPCRTKAFYAHYQNNGAPDTKRVALGLCVLINGKH